MARVNRPASGNEEDAPMQLAGKTAAITGGTQGIGLGIAQAFVREGAQVALMGRNAENGARAIAELGGAGNTRFYAATVKEKEGIDGFVQDTIDHFGQVDIMVNNAGGADGLGARLGELSDEVWDDTMKWNLYATFWGMRAALRDMAPRSNGRIINISSVEGKHGNAILAGITGAMYSVDGGTAAY
jgi:3-hydroxybutyrate dehydrogenase